MSSDMFIMNPCDISTAYKNRLIHINTIHKMKFFPNLNLASGLENPRARVKKDS